MATEFQSESQKLKFQDDVLSFLYDTYYDDGKPVQGQSVSYVLGEMRSKLGGRGWRGIGTLHDFEILLEAADFVILPLRNNRNQKARVITL